MPLPIVDLDSFLLRLLSLLSGGFRLHWRMIAGPDSHSWDGTMETVQVTTIATRPHIMAVQKGW